jgi:hypothetical protein
VSLALFPVAYKSVRYFPAYFNEPVYVDAIGYRSDSIPIQKWGENFGWNYEYDEFAVMVDEDKESPRYVTFEEAVEYNLGRIIPGTEEFLRKSFSKELLESSLARAKYYFEQGIYDLGKYDNEAAYAWNTLYYPEEELVEQENVSLTENGIIQIYNNIIQKLLKTLVLNADAEGFFKAGNLEQVSGGRGDSEEYPWYTSEEFPGNGMELRMAIHEYAISKLNFEGHPAGSFGMWIASWSKLPHAHNIFLIAGYNFGILTMILMVLLFIVSFLTAMYNVVRLHKVEYLLTALLVAGITVFGWFEKGFDYKTGIMMWVFLCVIFTDILRVKE